MPPILGGAVEKMWFVLGKKFVLSGHEVTHISRSFKGLPNEEWLEGVRHIRVKGYNTPSSGLYLKFLDLLYTSRAKSLIPADTDIIVTNTFWAPIVFSNKFKKKCMIDVARMPKGQMRLYKGSGRLRANSSAVVRAIKKELSPIDHRKVVMIPNPIPFENFPLINLNNKKPVILYAGRIHPEKGIELLIKAFRAVKGNWKLKIVGPSEISAGGGGVLYLNKLKELAGHANVEFCEPIFNIDLLNMLYEQASIFAYPSIAEQGETFGLAPLEAMAWGCVPIVSDLSCFRDFIHHDINGIVFDHRQDNAVNLLSEAIESLEVDVVFREKLAAEALKVRESHSTSVIGEEFLRHFTLMTSETKNHTN